MKLELNLIQETDRATLSGLTVEGTDYFAFVIEDKFQEVKVPGETRIPEGSYLIEKRTWGTHFGKYQKKFGHEFSIWLREVPNFEHILIHIGNDISDTQGCLLVNYNAAYDEVRGQFIGSRSTPAYKDLYKLMKSAFDKGESVHIEINRQKIQEVEIVKEIEVIKEVERIVEVEKPSEPTEMIDPKASKSTFWEIVFELFKNWAFKR